MKELWNRILRFVDGRLFPAGLMLAAAIVLPLSLQNTGSANYTYLLQQDGEPVAIFGMPREDADYAYLSVRSSASVLGDAQLLLDKGQKVTLLWGDREETVSSRHETVSHLLHRLRIEPAEDDMVVLDMTGDHLTIRITDYWLYSWEKTVETTYKTERVANPLRDKDTEEVVQTGADGAYVETYLNLYIDGELRSTSYIGKSDDTAVNEIVEYGTRVDSVARDDRIAEDHPDGSGGGYLTFVSGETLTYSSVMLCNATAYAIHGYGATGYPTEVGNIAVDPTVIPYGTRMFIQTVNGSWVYGMAVARDCGSAVKGNIIDLWFEDIATCYQWGRRDCTVYILN